MPDFPKDPQKLYALLNKLYFEDNLPPMKSIKFIDPSGEGAFLDSRKHQGACLQDDDGNWHMELHSGLLLSADLVALVMAHEMIHVKYGKKALRHGTKLWKEEYRRLAGLGFFMAVF